MMAVLLNTDTWAALLTLTVLEIVLGVDNLVFLAITSSRLPPQQQPLARRIGLLLALVLRVGLLSTLTWISALTQPIYMIGDFALSWRDVVLGTGGFYLLYKGVAEIHEAVEGPRTHQPRAAASLFATVIQIMALDLVFSLDSIVTAVGMTNNLPVMIAAIVISILVMMFAANVVSDFIMRHPTVKMLALAFLLLVGMALVADGAHFHIPRGYLYSAITFSIMVEGLNLTRRRGARRRGDDVADRE
ncbi:MAG: TerC family protein [Rhodospirillaceae bacterium]|nr:MAG: TerC family protein [Rhodospirillaceae bacterium]